MSVNSGNEPLDPTQQISPCLPLTASNQSIIMDPHPKAANVEVTASRRLFDDHDPCHIVMELKY